MAGTLIYRAGHAGQCGTFRACPGAGHAGQSGTCPVVSGTVATGTSGHPLEGVSGCPLVAPRRYAHDDVRLIDIANRIRRLAPATAIRNHFTLKNPRSRDRSAT